MVITKTIGTVFVFCFLLGVVLASIGGWYLGTNYILNSWVQEQSRDVDGHVKTLRMLIAGKIRDSEPTNDKLLERLLSI